MKITGGSLKVKTLLSSNSNGQILPGRKAEEAAWEEKADQIRLYSGAKYELTPEAEAGTVCAVTGLREPIRERDWELNRSQNFRYWNLS